MKKKSRKDEIIELIPAESVSLCGNLVDDIVYLEQQLVELKKYPFIEIHPTNPARQRQTPASKMYKELLQQYINAVKVVEGIIYKDKRLTKEEKEESPLRAWFNAMGMGNK